MCLSAALAFHLMFAVFVAETRADEGSRTEGRPALKEDTVQSEQPTTVSAVPDGPGRPLPVEVVPPAPPVPHTGGDKITRPAPPAPRVPARLSRDMGTVLLNFSDAGLRDILRTIADITGENFIIAPGVAAKISVQTTKPVLRKDVFGIFESILEVNGLAAVKTGQYYKIVQAQTAKQHAMDLIKNTGTVPDGDRMVNMANTLIITDTASNMKGFLEIIAVLDVDSFKRTNIALIQIKNVDVKTLDRELADVFSALGLGKDATQLAVVPIERLNSMMLFAASEPLLASAKEWIERLDQVPSADTASVHIYYVQNDKASTISGLLEQLYGVRKSSASSHPSQPPALSGAAPAAAQAATPKPDIAIRKEGGVIGEDMKIFVYEPSNALIIQSSERDYQSLLTTLQKLDVPPKQVLIDALIAEIKLDEGLKYGIQWSLLSGNANVQQNTGIFPATIANPKDSITAPIGLAAPMGLAAVATDAKKFFGAIQALSVTGKVNVLSNPHILVKNYEKASINVGSDEPVATQSTQTAVTGTSGLIQNIEYRKTGIILTVTPQITEGGMVAMTIRQEVSDKSTDRTVGSAIYPSFSKREAETSVVAKDGEPLVIGGLIQDKRDVEASGVPFLSKIPFLGALFRFTSDTTEKTELVVLITPKVISNPVQASMVSSEIKARLEDLKELLKNSKYGRK